jgi:thiosulfate dehydrogenase
MRGEPRPRRARIVAPAIVAWIAAAFVAAAAQQPAEIAWRVPNADALPAGIWKDTVLYGRRLFTETPGVIGPEVADTAMRYSGNNLTCQSCHLLAGTQAFALPMVGVFAVFPAYLARENEVRTIEDRIEGCLERSMNGRALPPDGREMKAMVAYLQFMSTDVPVGKTIEGRSTPLLPLLDRAADPVKGRAVYAATCAACHQADGQGLRKGKKGDAAGYLFPPLWGPDSFNDGAGMHRLIASASYIRANMPLGTTYRAPMLGVEDAWDVAAFVNSQPRPARAHLDLDYPDRAKKPVDAPFPPFADAFPLEQHRLGPFKPIMDAQKAKQPAAGSPSSSR